MDNSNKIYVIVFYIRLSSEDINNHQDGKEESNSISNQRLYLQKYVQGQPEFAKAKVMELCDDGYTGTNMNRPGMTQLLELARKKQIDCVIVKDFSRFGRDYLTVSDYVDQIFPFMGIRFISVNDRYDSANCNGATSGVEMAFRNVIYGYYSQDLSVKIKSSQRAEATQGNYMGAIAPVGYQKSPANHSQLIVEPIGAEIVKRIFHMAAEGKPTVQIVRQLIAEGVPTASELKISQGCKNLWKHREIKETLWDRSMVAIILRDERYLGTNVFGKGQNVKVGDSHRQKVERKNWIVVENCHEPIITKQEFETVQANLKKTGRRTGKPPINLFSGKLRCGDCGWLLSRVTQPKVCYTCFTRYKKEACNCMTGSIKETDLVGIVLTAIKAYATAFLNEQTESRGKANADGLSSMKKQIHHLQGELAKLKESKAQAYDMLAEQEIDRAAFHKRQAALSKQQNIVEQQCDALQGELGNLKRILSNSREEASEWQSYQGAEVLNRAMVEALIDCIYVYKDKSMHIQWRFDIGAEK